jgi:hypothetical protein
VAANLAAKRITSAHADAITVVAEGIDTAHDVAGIIWTRTHYRALAAIAVAPAV